MSFQKSFLLSGFLIFITSFLFSQADKFQQPAGFQDLHTVYEYKKSNWDGSHASTIFLYVSDTNRLESFKLWMGEKTATLVSAVMDWSIFSIRKFQNHRLRDGQVPQLVAQLEMGADNKLRIEAGPVKDSMDIESLPWQSYDFDFAGLGFIWRALKDKNSSFWFHIADAAQKDGNMNFVNKGRVQVDFNGYEKLNGKECLKYKIDGEGLENKGGTIWIDPETFMIVKYMIALPDEPGFVNGMLELISTKKMTPVQWEAFMKERLVE